MRLLIFGLLGLSFSLSGHAGRGTKVFVWKAKRRLEVVDAAGKVIRNYNIALGGSPVGPKRCEGDEKTPEGEYRLGWIHEKSRFHRSIHVSYPNPSDRARAKELGCEPGGDIFVHGVGSMGGAGSAHTARDWTLGCIAVTNAEIDEIISLLTLPVPIHIHP